MKSHLKRLASPRTWPLRRKKRKACFISRPRPGPHSQEGSLPLGLLLRDFLSFAHTMQEAKKLLNNRPVLIDGERRKDSRLPVGLFDVLSFPETKENFRLLLDRKGRLALKAVKPAESSLKPCKIIGKTALPGRIQLNLHDGRNLLVDLNFPSKVGDTLLITLPDQKIKELLSLKKDAFVFLTKGKRAGDAGLLQEIKGELAIYQKDSQTIETLKEYLFVLGDKKPVIDIHLENPPEEGSEK